MKKFKNIGKTLSREELKNISGGIIGGGFTDPGIILPGGGGDKGCGSCYSAYDCGGGCNMCSGARNGNPGYCDTFKFY